MRIPDEDLALVLAHAILEALQRARTIFARRGDPFFAENMEDLGGSLQHIAQTVYWAHYEDIMEHWNFSEVDILDLCTESFRMVQDSPKWVMLPDRESPRKMLDAIDDLLRRAESVMAGVRKDYAKEEETMWKWFEAAVIRTEEWAAVRQVIFIMWTVTLSKKRDTIGIQMENLRAIGAFPQTWLTSMEWARLYGSLGFDCSQLQRIGRHALPC